MKSLPPSKRGLSTSLTQAAATRDPTEWEQAIQLGYQMIDTMYQPHWFWRPFDVFRRQRARHWWEQQIRLTGQQMGMTLLEVQKDIFGDQIRRPVNEEREEYAIRRAAELEALQHGYERDRIEREAEARRWRTEKLRPLDEADDDYTYGRQRKRQEAEAEWQRTQREFETEQQIKVARATMSPQPDPNASVKEVLQMMAEIEQDPTLDDEQKRRRLELLKWQFNQLGGTR